MMGGGKQKTQVTMYSGLQVQATSSAVPIPIVYGVNVLTPNIVWYNNFQRHEGKSSKAGSKGGSVGGKKVKTYTYSAALIMALCEGPIAGIQRVWQTSAAPIDLATTGMSLVTGTSYQAAWSYTASYYPAEALAYRGLAYLCHPYFDLGSSASVGNNSFEVHGVLAYSSVNSIDADPAQMVLDFLTNPQYGVGFPYGSIDLTTVLSGTIGANYQAYCWANGLALSPALNQQEPANSIIARWLELTNTTAVWSGGKLRFIPYGDTAGTGSNGTVSLTYTPNLTPIYDLTDEDFVYQDGTDPVVITRSDPYSCPNQQSIEIVGRNDNYVTGPVTVWDQSQIDRFGLRTGSSITAHEVCDVAMGQKIAQMILQRNLYVRNTYKFQLSWEFCLLDPMDLITLTDSVLGLSKAVVRITDIEEDDSGILTVTAEEFPQGIATSAAYTTQAKSNGVPDSSVAAPPVATPIIFTPPAALASTPQVWIGATGTGNDPNYGGCIIWASLDGTSYSEVATLSGSSTMGTTTASLATYGGANPDNTNVLAVNIADCGGSLTTTSSINASAGLTTAYVGGEFISFTTANLTGVGTYSLYGLYRGLNGVAASSHASGSKYLFLGGNMIRWDVSGYSGHTVYLKFQSYNIFGAGVQDITTCTVYTFAIP